MVETNYQCSDLIQKKGDKIIPIYYSNFIEKKKNQAEFI